MPKSDLSLVETGDLGTALTLMTTLPAQRAEAAPPRPALLSVWAWPLAGLAIALIAALVAVLLRKLDMGAGLAAAGALLTLVALTGARHEAALSRAVRGFSKPAQRDDAAPEADLGPRALRQDDQIAAQMTVLLVTVARWSALASLLAAGHGFGAILAAAVLSRGALPLLLVALSPSASASTVATEAVAPPRASAALALVVALGLALFCLGWALIPAVAGIGVIGVALGLALHVLPSRDLGDDTQGCQPMLDLAVLAALLAAL